MFLIFELKVSSTRLLVNLKINISLMGIHIANSIFKMLAFPKFCRAL